MTAIIGKRIRCRINLPPQACWLSPERFRQPHVREAAERQHLVPRPHENSNRGCSEMKSYKKTPLLFLVLLVIAVATATAALRGQRQGQPSAGEEEPTPIQEGVMTKKQKEHGKIFKGYGWFTRGQKIRDLVAGRGDVEVWAPLETTPLLPPVNLGDYLQKLTCDADAVAIVKVKSKSSNLVEDGTFLFTDYEATAEVVLKNNAAASLQQGGNLTVTRGGGAVVLNGHTVKAIDPNLRRLVVGERYLLYLRFIPTTGAYRAFANSLSEDTFLLQGDTVSQVSRKKWPLGLHSTADAGPFMTEVHNALNFSCIRGGEQ